MSTKGRGKYLSSKRVVSALLSVFLSISLIMPGVALAAESELKPTCDEAFYATLDYYGNLQESSVVKSYVLHGATSLTDYGQYSSVENLCNDLMPVTDDSSITFDFGEEEIDKFYFEGKTEHPYYEMPWDISISYTLNGVPSKAENLANKVGVIGITLDILPREDATAYSKNNMVLLASTAFNDNDIVSLKAPGAQVQLLGNLRTVIYLVMPGEERHFTMEVGSEGFTFPGMLFMGVPATLAQLDQITDLREEKDKIQSSYDQVSSSMDTILDALDGMSDDLYQTANGLDNLNQARIIFNSNRDNLYAATDEVISSLTTIEEALEPAGSHLENADQALTETTACLTKLTDLTVGLQEQLTAVKEDIENLQQEFENSTLIQEDLDADRIEKIKNAMKNLYEDMRDMGYDMDELEDSSAALGEALARIEIAELEALDLDALPYDENMTVGELKQYMQEAESAYTQYQAVLASGIPNIIPAGTKEEDFPFVQFLMAVAGKSAEEAEQINLLYLASQDQATLTQLAAAQEKVEAYNQMLPVINSQLQKLDPALQAISGLTAAMLSDVSSLSATLGRKGVSREMETLAINAYMLLDDLDGSEEKDSHWVDDIDSMMDTMQEIIETLDASLTQVQALDDIINKYVPDIRQAISEAITMVEAAQQGISNSSVFLAELENAAKTSHANLDQGNQQILTGLSAALRSTAQSLEQVNTIRDAKDSIEDVIEDEWENNTGGNSRLLNMDPNAVPVSLTSPQNPAPNSIQLIMRTQEIKEEKTADVNDEENEAHELTTETFFTRVNHMFTDIWQAIVNIFA